VQNLQERLQKARSAGVTTEQIEELQEECASMKRIILCSVCNKIPKQVVLSKCWHLFCKECVGKRLTGRSRKCPSCSTAFGATDVHEVFM
jgi:E3 ubiquitin-protein ligase BRE1